jgi:zinc metalloprotease ZmpB
LIGGMSYEVDPKLKAPPRETPAGRPGHGCNDEASKLLDCLDLPHDSVKRVRVSRVVIEVDLDKDCD